MACVVESLLAAVQRHYFGIVVGLLASALSWYLVCATRSLQYSGTWLFRIASLVAVPVAVYILGLIVIKGMSGVFLDNVPTTTFPSSCAPNLGCARVAITGSQGLSEMAVPEFAAAPSALYEALHEVLKEQFQVFRVSPKDEGPGYMQAVWLSTAWGFPDDVFARLTCNHSLVMLEMQSQQRFGTSDFGTNAGHIRVILTALRAAAGSLVPLPCVIEDRAAFNAR